MTRLRKLAVGISRGVVRHCPPGSKDWAQATTRELEFIEGDWAALCWALGSMRILLRCKDAPLASLEAVPKAARGLEKKIRSRMRSVCGIAVVESTLFAFFLRGIHYPIQRTGCYLVIASMVWMMLQVLVRRSSRVPSETDLSIQAKLYRLDLVEEIRFHSGMWFWSRLVLLNGGLVLFFVGAFLAHPVHLFAECATLMVVPVLSVIGARLNRWQAAAYRHRLEELDEVLLGGS